MDGDSKDEAAASGEAPSKNGDGGVDGGGNVTCHDPATGDAEEELELDSAALVAEGAGVLEEAEEPAETTDEERAIAEETSHSLLEAEEELAVAAPVLAVEEVVGEDEPAVEVEEPAEEAEEPAEEAEEPEEPAQMTDEERAIVEKMSLSLMEAEEELAADALSLHTDSVSESGKSGSGKSENSKPRQPDDTASTSSPLPPLPEMSEVVPHDPSLSLSHSDQTAAPALAAVAAVAAVVALPAASTTSDSKPAVNLAEKKVEKKRESSSWSLFGKKKSEEPKEEVELEDAPDVSSELCALIVKDIDAILKDPARKSSSLVKILQEAQEKVLEVDKKAQDASAEIRLLSCAAVLKAGVQASELKHKSLSVKGLTLLRRLASHQMMQAVYFPAVSKAMRACAESNDEVLQLKVLQVCAAAAESERLACSIGPALSIIECILVVMGGSLTTKNPGASMAAEATLHQAVKAMLRFVQIRSERFETIDNVQGPDKNKAHDSVAAAADVSAQVLREIMVMCTPKSSERLKYRKSERGTGVALDVIQDILNTRASVMSKYPVLSDALEECVFPILLKQLQRIGAGTLRLLPREEQSAYASRVSMAVQYMNAVSSVVSNFPHAQRVGKEDNSFLLSTVANMLSVLVTMAQEAKPSWVRLLALEVLHDFVTGPSLDYRIQQIFMLCRSYDEWDEGGSTENIIVSLAATFEALAVKLLDVPGSNAGEKADKVLISEKLVPAKGQKDKPLITLTRSLVLAPLESDAGRWTRGLEALKYGDLTSLGGGNDAVLTPQEIKKNKAARALLVERVRAEIAVVCGAQMMEAIGNLCGVVNWRIHSQNRHDTGLSVSTTNTAGSTTSKESISTTNVRGGDAGGVRVSAQPSMDAELMEVNAEACWHLMETCVPSLLNLSRVSIKSIDLESVLRSTMRAHSTITQTAAVLQIVHVRDSALENLCQMAEAGMQGIPGLDFGPTPSTASTTASNATAATAIASYVPAIWDWRRTLVTEELLGVILEVAAVMHEGWAKVLPVLQRLHFELSARVRLEKAHVAAAGALRVPVVRENSKDSKSSQDSKRLSANDVKNALEAPASPAKTSSTAEVEVMPVVEEFLPVADIGIPASALLASLEGLFCGSWCLPDKAVVALLNELGAQSRDCVVRTGESYPENGELEQAPSPTPPTVGNGRFGMEQTLVVVRHNFFRLNVLWGALSNQLAQMLAHQRASMRTYGAQCYTEISLEALTFLSGHELLKKEAIAGQLDAELCASTERSIADSYLQMYTNSSFSDMRRALLVGLQALLQACKSKTIRISTGWQSLLNLLMIVPKQESEPIQLREASECLKVICESLLSYVPVEDMENLAKCLETMGSQDTDQKSAEGAMSVLVDLASFLTANRVPLIARLVGHGASSTLASPPSVLSEKELQVRTAVQEKAASILELLIGKVLTSLLSLGLDRRVKVREEALQGLFSLLTTDAYFSEPARLMLTCRHKLLAFLDAVAQHVESAEEDGSLCWQHWLATWLSVVQGTALLLETGMTVLYCHTQPAQQALDVEKENVGLVDGLAAWEGINTRLGVALTCGNMFVVRAAIKAITVPLARVGDQIPRAAWDVVWEKMPLLLAAAQQKSETKSPSGRRQLPGPMLASVVVEELMELCEKPSVQRGCTSLAGQASLVSVGNLSSLTSLVAAATSDFRTTSPEAPVSGKADTRETPETRRQQATRLYTVLVQAACERNQSEAEEVWEQVMWSLLRHLPGRPSLDYSWGADITVPDKFAPLANGMGCADMAANLLALLLLNEAPSYILRVTVEPVSVGMLLAMCGRYSGVVFREWRAVTAAFVVVLFASIKILNREQDETDINGDESPALPRHLAGKEQERRIRVVRRLTGGIKSFLLPPDGYQVPVEPAPAPKKSAAKTGADKVLTKRGPDTEEDAAVAEIESSVVQALIKHVIPRAEEPVVRKDLLLLLDTIVGASCSGAGGKDLLARSCLEGLLALAEAQQTDSELGETEDVHVVDPSKSELDVVNLAAKVAVERCRDVLESYLSYEIAVEEAQSRKDKINGQVNPVKSLELAVTAIHGLEKLRIYPATFDFLLQNLESAPTTSRSQHQCSFRGEQSDSAPLAAARRAQCIRLVSEGFLEDSREAKQRGHHLLLYPLIVNSIATDNALIRKSARNMLHSLGHDLGIGI